MTKDNPELHTEKHKRYATIKRLYQLQLKYTNKELINIVVGLGGITILCFLAPHWTGPMWVIMAYAFGMWLERAYQQDVARLKELDKELSEATLALIKSEQHKSNEQEKKS